MEGSRPMHEQRSVDSADWLAAAELPSDDDGDLEVNETDEETLPDDEQDISNPDADEEPPAADSDTDEEAEQTETEDTPAVFEWDGDPEKLPPALEYEGVVYDLGSAHKSMLTGHNKKSQRLSEENRRHMAEAKRLQEENESLRAYYASRQAGDADPRPTPPTTENQAEWRKYDEDMARWAVRDETRRYNMPQIGDEQAPAAPTSQEEIVEKRFVLLESQDGWDESFYTEMSEIAQGDPHWQKMLKSDAGAVSFFKFVKKQREADGFKQAAAEKESQSVRRRARAANSTVPRTANASGRAAADNYADVTWDNVAD